MGSGVLLKLVKLRLSKCAHDKASGDYNNVQRLQTIM